MRRLTKSAFVLLLLLHLFRIITHCSSFNPYWQKFSENSASCALKNLKLLSLFNLLCNSTQQTSVQLRDACYGCFFRSSNSQSKPMQLSSLRECVQLYFANTSYGSCSIRLDGLLNVDSNFSPASCSDGYCEFVRCVRRINAQQLIASCFAENLAANALELDIERVLFYTNVTACILARMRCSQYNPISGVLQYQYPTLASLSKKVTNIGSVTGNTFSTQTPTPLNALQVLSNGDIRIITLYHTTIASISDDLCINPLLVPQATYRNYIC